MGGLFAVPGAVAGFVPVRGGGRGALVLVGFLVLGLLVSWHHQSLNFGFSQGLLRFFPEFLIGMGTARLLPHYGGLRAGPGPALAGLALVAARGGRATRILSRCSGCGCCSPLSRCRHEAGWQPLLGRPAALLAFGRLSYAFYMSFAVAELLLVNLFRQRGWVPAAHPFLFAGGMSAVTLALALALHRLVESPAKRRAERLLAVN